MAPYRPIAELDSNPVYLGDLRKDPRLKDVAGRLRGRLSVSAYWPDLYKLIVRKNSGIKGKLKNYEPAEA